MEKIYGTTIRQDGLLQIGRKNWQLFYGLYEDEHGTYEYRHTFDHKPTLAEVKAVILAQINANVEERIATNFVWNGISVYLSSENQMNFKAAYDIALQQGGATLPMTFKLGEDEKGESVYYVFNDMDTFSHFYIQAIAHVNQTLNEGWQEKDSIDWTKFVCDE